MNKVHAKKKKKKKGSLKCVNKHQTLWIKQSSHPEDIWPTLEYPTVELIIPLQ